MFERKILVDTRLLAASILDSARNCRMSRSSARADDGASPVEINSPGLLKIVVQENLGTMNFAQNAGSLNVGLERPEPAFPQGQQSQFDVEVVRNEGNVNALSNIAQINSVSPAGQRPQEQVFALSHKVAPSKCRFE